MGLFGASTLIGWRFGGLLSPSPPLTVVMLVWPSPDLALILSITSLVHLPPSFAHEMTWQCLGSQNPHSVPPPCLSQNAVAIDLEMFCVWLLAKAMSPIEPKTSAVNIRESALFVMTVS